jgi:hypothetical protein
MAQKRQPLDAIPDLYNEGAVSDWTCNYARVGPTSLLWQVVGSNGLAFAQPVDYGSYQYIDLGSMRHLQGVYNSWHVCLNIWCDFEQTPLSLPSRTKDGFQ